MSSTEISGSDALPSHPGRDTDADADVSLERKRPRLSDDEPLTPGSPVIEVVDDPTPSPEPVIITSRLDSTPAPSELLCRFPFVDQKFPTAQAAARCLADEIIENEDVNCKEMEQLATWLSLARAEKDPSHFEDSQFWFEVCRIIIGLLRRDSLHKNRFSYERMAPVLVTLGREMAHICAMSLEYEATNVDSSVSRRDSVRTENGNGNGIEDAPYRPLLAPCIQALSTLLQPKCELYRELDRRGNLQRFATTTTAARAFIETSRELEVVSDLFDKYMANMTAIETPYNHIVRLTELSSRLINVYPPDQSVKLSPLAFERISTIFDETYFKVYQKMLSMQSRELPELHQIALDALSTMVHRLSRDHDGFADKLFDKLVQRASQRTNQSQGALQEEIAQTRTRCGNLMWECTPYLFRLDMALGLIRSGIRDHRITGIALSNTILLAAWEYVKNRRQDGNLGQDPLCQTLALCCLHLDFMSAIFGSDSHADVISQAAGTVNFLLVTKRFTTAEVDMILTKLSSSSQPDIKQACISTLAHTTSLYFTLDHISHVLGRLAELQSPPIVMWRVWIIDAGKRFAVLSENEIESSIQLELAEKIVTLLEHLYSFDVVDNLDVIVRELLTFLNLVASSQETATHLVKYCVDRVGKGTKAATGAVQALNLLLSTSLTTSVTDMADMCSPVSIFEPALSDLEAYTASRTAYVAESGLIVDTVSSATLVPRVHLVLYALTTLGQADADPHEETIWNLVVGAGRSVGVQAMVDWFHQRQGLLSAFGHRCVEQFLPHLPPEHATAGLVDLHVLLEKGVRPSSVVLKSSLLEQLTRLSLFSLDRDLSALFEGRVCSWLFGKAAQEHHEEAQQAQAAVIQQCLRALTSESTERQLEALHLLRRLVCDSSTFEAATTTRCSAMKLNVFEVGAPTGEQGQGQIKLNIEALSSSEPSKQFSLLVAPSLSLLELKTAILHHTGFSQLRAHSLGKAFDLDRQSSIEDSGLTNNTSDCALLVQRVWSFDDIINSDTLPQSDSAVQQTLLVHHSQLHALLDIGETVEQACMLLKYLPIPLAFKVSVANLQSLPTENCWKAEYSVHVLQVILSQQTSHGIADANFISQSIRLLVNVLLQNSEQVAMHPLKTAVTALLSFLKERPVQDVSSEYFENPRQFILSVMQILAQLAAAEANNWMQDVTNELAEKTFGCLLEAMISCGAIRTALLSDDSFKERFKSLLRSGNRAIALVVGQTLANLCKATSLTPELTAMFWSCVEDLLVDIANDETIARAVFDAALVLLQSNKELLANETGIRSLVQRLVDLLRKIQPDETFNSSSFDHRVRLLCVLLRFCVVQLKSFKQPLDLGQVALDLFNDLLFPKVTTESGKPTRGIKHPLSRQVIFESIALLCDDRSTNALLVDAARESHHLAQEVLDNDIFFYPGRENYLRAEHSHVGLKNLGQTCYLNSLLQQLFMNYDFRKFILEINIPEDKQDQVLVHFRDLFSALHFSNISCHAPRELADILGIDVGVQEDAHLFFTMLISRLEDSMPDKETKQKLLSFFGGRNRSQTKGECGHVSESTDDYLNLSLTVKDKINLTESLQEYVAGASLEGGDKFKCTTCEEEGKLPYVNAMRRTGLETIPNTLILGLKRFRYESWDGGTKVNDRFEFPAELDMAPFKLENLANPSRSLQPDNFELIGVIVHQGTLQMGHYWSYAKDHRTYGQQPGSWFRMEDASVTSCDLEFILRECMGGDIQLNNGDWCERSDSAYILIYRRLAASHAAIEPEIVLPEAIARSNSMLETKVHVFDVAHTHFIQQLLNQMDTFTDLDRRHECAAIELALMHLSRVTTNKVDVTDNDVAFQHLVQKAVLRNVENSKYLLAYVFDRGNIERFVLSGTTNLQTAINAIVLAALGFLRREDPRVYGLPPHDVVTAAVGREGANKGPTEGATTEATTKATEGITEETTEKPAEGPTGQTLQGPHDDSVHSPDLPGDAGLADAGLKSGGLAYAVIEALASLLPAAERHRMNWASYLELVAGIANFDVRETRVVLDFGFLEWCLDCITSRFPRARWSRFSDESLPLRKWKSTWIVLADRINALLAHVDVSRSPPINDSATTDSLRRKDLCVHGQTPFEGCRTRSVSDGKCSLNSVELDLLLDDTDLNFGRSTLLRSLCQDHVTPKDIANWAPYRLIQTLMKADDRTVTFLLNAMEFWIHELPGDRVARTGVAIGICLSTAVPLNARNCIMNAVTFSLRGTATDVLFWFFEAMMQSPDMSSMVWESLNGWFIAFLKPRESYLAENTSRWLCKTMLLRHVFTIPSSEAALEADIARIRAAVRMHKATLSMCRGYMKLGTELQFMDAIFKTFLGLQQHLARVFSIFFKGTLDQPRLMKDIMTDADLPELSNEDSNSQNPLVQHGGTIRLPHQAEDLISGCFELINKGKVLKQEIEDYKLEEEESDEEEDYEEEYEEDFEEVYEDDGE